MVCGLAGCGFQKEVLLTGQTMGTTYHIKAIVGYLNHTSELKNKIDQRLQQINSSMSVFAADSEISRFNALNQAGEMLQISEDFYTVLTIARRLYDMTDGAWDGTVDPLINLWGFGVSGRRDSIPDDAMIRKLKTHVGFNLIDINENRSVSKKNPLVSLNLSSIAKGYAVDEIDKLIRNMGIKNCLVEIGGEVRASGRKMDRTAWKVGVNTPRKNSPHDQVYEALALENKSVATSGDYRNYFEKDGKTYSHIIHPGTGYPVNNTVVSVSVISDSCAFSDGLATAVMVMGVKNGLALIHELPGVECLIVACEPDGTTADYVSQGFKRYLVSPYGS